MARGLAKEERPVRALRFTGFLGIWNWPLVNILLERLAAKGTGMSLRGRGSLTPSMANVERWEWVDSKGRKRQLVIHREVRE